MAYSILKINFSILLSLVFFGCSQKDEGQTTNGLARMTLTNSSTTSALSLDVLEKMPPIDGTKLSVSELNVSSISILSHQFLKIEFKEDPLADYHEFTSCNELNECSPSLNSPQKLDFSGHIYPSAPSGLLTVSLRACVRNYNAVILSQNCGTWVQAKTKHLAQKNVKTLEFFSQIYELENKSLPELSERLRTAFTHYLARSSSLLQADTQDKQHELLKNIAANTEVVGEDSLRQWLMSEEFLEAHNALLLTSFKNESESMSLADSQGDGLNTAVGSVLIVEGSGILIYLAYKYYKAKQDMKKLKQDLDNPITSPALARALSVGFKESYKSSVFNRYLEKSQSYKDLKKFVGETSELKKLIVENPETVISKAKVNEGILSFSKEGLTPMQQLQYNKYEKLKKLQPLTELQSKDFDRIKEALTNSQIIDGHGNYRKLTDNISGDSLKKRMDVREELKSGLLKANTMKQEFEQAGIEGKKDIDTKIRNEEVFSSNSAKYKSAFAILGSVSLIVFGALLANQKLDLKDDGNFSLRQAQQELLDQIKDIYQQLLATRLELNQLYIQFAEAKKAGYL